ncbi:HK97 family phage prohead protease [Granulicella sp. dw_53]|uniref:HK97 family phage prohead protease n=1 Tax=Granulicella sp. dw_53 TaxID=2719792 RepID=UPI001BD6CDE7|nr:HK97 family phage prohead protease [Granulicella sp. dw_53]
MQYHRDFSLKVKALDDNSGTFTGYASTYGGPPDLVGDIIMPGAFKRSIDNQGDGVVLLWSHSTSDPLGRVKLSDSPAGLVVNGSMVMADPAAQRAYAHLKAGSIKGLSIGYSLPPESSGKVTYNSDGTRTIREIKLYEVSLVAIPANPLAQVTSVKSLQQFDELLRSFKADDVDSETLASLRSIRGTLRSLLQKKDAGCVCDCSDCPDNCDACTDQCDLCDGDACTGCVAARADADELAATADALKAFAAELKGLMRPSSRG